jgi:hypothetical protein
VAGIVTAPIHKEALAVAGIPYPGHTEILADLGGADRVAMMLANDEIRTVLVTIHCSLAEAIRKAGSTDTEKLVEAMRGLQVNSPFGRFTYRAIDHQATMGAYVGTTAVNLGRGVMKDFRYIDGATVLPSDAEVRKLRPAEAMQ